MFTVDRLCYCNVIVAGCGVVSWLRFGGWCLLLFASAAGCLICIDCCVGWVRRLCVCLGFD